MPKCLLKKVLPFTLMFLIGAALGSVPNLWNARHHRKHGVARMQKGNHDVEVVVRKKSCRYSRNNFYPQAHAWTHVLSTEMSSDDRHTNSKGWTPASILVRPNPLYTEAAREAGVEGVVRLTATFGADGKVSDIEPISELPYGLTDEAINSVEQIRFVPASFKRQPVSTHGTVDVVFHLTRNEQCAHED